MTKKERQTVAVALMLVDQLQPYANNARKHSEQQVQQLVASIKAFGYTNPVLLDGRQVVAGHGRLRAVQAIYAAGGLVGLPSGELLPENTIPCIDCAGWSEVQRRAYILADNKLPEWASWDEGLLVLELDYLESAEFDLQLTGFTDAEYAKLIAPEGGTDTMAEWEGMPEFQQGNLQSFRAIVVHFNDQAGVDAFAELLGRKLTDKTKFMWFPEIKAEVFADKRYVDEGSAEAQAAG